MLFCETKRKFETVTAKCGTIAKQIDKQKQINKKTTKKKRKKKKKPPPKKTPTTPQTNQPPKKTHNSQTTNTHREQKSTDVNVPSFGLNTNAMLYVITSEQKLLSSSFHLKLDNLVQISVKDDICVMRPKGLNLL